MIHLPAGDAPVLRTADVAVAGGSLAGISAALELRKRGLRILVVEPRTYLGREITATLRPWVRLDGDSELWSDLLARIGLRSSAGEIPLHMDALKVALEDMLLEAGVDLLYASRPVAVLHGANGIEGMMIGNKSGSQMVSAPTLVDATESALLTRLAGGEFEPLPAVARFSRTLEFDRVRPLPEGSLPVPERLGVVGDAVRLHKGYRGQEHVFVEFGLELPAGASLERSMEREVAAREVSMALAAFLITEVPGFAEAYLGSASYELAGPHIGRVSGPESEPFAGPLPGLWCLNEAARVLDPAAFRDPIEGVRLGKDAGAAIAAHPMRQVARGARDEPQEGTPSGLEVRMPESPRPGFPYDRRSVPAAEVPCSEADVLVVGGGTSGATAAITAAREGARVVLVEMNPGLGGTGTIGGVNNYWYGRHVGFSAQVQRWTEAVQQSLRQSKPAWNIEAKIQALLCEAIDAGVTVIWNAVSFAALVERGDCVRGVVAATPWGSIALQGQVVIDATGDGDVAAFAGAKYVYGADLDHTTMWYSLGQFTTPGRVRNNFTSSVEVSNVEDYTRAILAGRRRGNAVHDHGVYLAPRESRHILAEIVLTHTDQLIMRHWPDVVNVHYSNHDVKGPSTSPWVRMGLIPPNLEIEVPYRALIPRGLEGIIITGRAISATHDALAAIRMQADMENLGGVAALAAVQALKEGANPRDIDVPALQRRLVDECLLSEEVLARKEDAPTLDEQGLHALVERIDGSRPLYAYSDMEMGEVFSGRIPFVDACTAGPEIVPYLEQALAGSAGLRRVHLAQALAYHGSAAAVPVLIEEIGRYLSGAMLPARENEIRHANYPPDQGAMPDAVYLLYSLGMTRDRRSLPLFSRVVELLDATEEDLRDRRKGTFYYVEAIAWGLEQLADEGAIPILRRLHSYPPFRDQVCRRGFQADIFGERQALLELCIARAQTRCGDEEGLRTLIAYLDDARGLLAMSARSHLVAITGEDYGWSASAWSAERVGERRAAGHPTRESPDCGQIPPPESTAPEPVRQ